MFLFCVHTGMSSFLRLHGPRPPTADAVGSGFRKMHLGVQNVAFLSAVLKSLPSWDWPPRPTPGLGVLSQFVPLSP